MANPKPIKAVLADQETHGVRHNEFVNALLLARHDRVYGEDDTSDISESTWGVLHREAAWWQGRYQDENIVRPPDNVTPDKIVDFYRWYSRKYPTYTQLRTREKIVEYWAEFEIDRSRMGRPVNGPSPITPAARDLELDRFDSEEYQGRAMSFEEFMARNPDMISRTPATDDEMAGRDLQLRRKLRS